MQLLLPFLGNLRKGLKKDGHDGLIEVCTDRQLLERIIFLLYRLVLKSSFLSYLVTGGSGLWLAILAWCLL